MRSYMDPVALKFPALERFAAENVALQVST